MDAGTELTVLTSTAAAQLVSLMTTDGWSAAKASISSIWHRSHRHQAEADLELSHRQLLEVRGSEHEGELRRTLEAEWQARLLALLLAYPEAAQQLRELSRAQASAANRPDQQKIDTMTITAHVTGGGDAYMAARDQTITHHHDRPSNETGRQ